MADLTRDAKSPNNLEQERTIRLVVTRSEWDSDGFLLEHIELKEVDKP